MRLDGDLIRAFLDDTRQLVRQIRKKENGPSAPAYASVRMNRSSSFARPYRLARISNSSRVSGSGSSL